MDIALLLEMAAENHGNRVILGSLDRGLTTNQVLAAAQEIGQRLQDKAVLIDLNSAAVPVLLFASAFGGVPFVPINYRLDDDRLRGIVERTEPATAFVGEDIEGRLGAVPGVELRPATDILATATAWDNTADRTVWTGPDDVAVLLFTSGTTGEPKAAVLRHRHLTAYVFSTVELGGADEDEATLISVPPYHIAGISAALTSVYAGRRMVYLDAFNEQEWVAVAERERITHAMVVPTMLRRILGVLEAQRTGLPSLRHLSYGGGAMPRPVIEHALEVLPHVDFVNAYGLTETSSTISVLGPDDHRSAMASSDERIRARLASVGVPVPSIELEIRDSHGGAVGPGEVGEIWVRGDQVAGEYREQGSRLDDLGWFRTRDGGWLDEDGYLFLEGRVDDVIVRGGENISPGEIEEVMSDHPCVSEAAVVGVPDEEWGEAVAAAVVLEPEAIVEMDELREWVRSRLRSTKTPQRIVVIDELPHNEMGKLLRRHVRELLTEPLPGHSQ